MPSLVAPPPIPTGGLGYTGPAAPSFSSFDIWDTPQVYETLQITNNKLALYQLWIQQPSAATSTSNSASSSIATPPPAASPVDPTGQGVTNFIFPLSPDSLNYSVVNLTSYFETQGISPSTDFGVRRIVDQYGVTPPIISISGTTGFKYHSLDGFQWDGKKSILRLEALIRTYAMQVKTQGAAGQPLPQLFFNDSWKQLTWQVVPIGPQNFQMSAGRPILTNYIISFIATDSANTLSYVSKANTDFISSNFFGPQPLIALGVQAFWAATYQALANGLSKLPGGPQGPLSILPAILQGPPAP